MTRVQTSAVGLAKRIGHLLRLDQKPTLREFAAASPWIGIRAAILSRRSIKWRLAVPLSRDRSSTYSLPLAAPIPCRPKGLLSFTNRDR